MSPCAPLPVSGLRVVSRLVRLHLVMMGRALSGQGAVLMLRKEASSSSHPAVCGVEKPPELSFDRPE
jgi:hypothetical protein